MSAGVMRRAVDRSNSHPTPTTAAGRNANLAKKRPPPPPKPTATPTFRPMADALKKLAEDKRREEKAESARAAAAQKATQPVKGRAAPRPPTPAPSATRAGTLTHDERRELDSMERDDEFFFQRLMSGVVPLGDDRRGRVTGAEPAPKRAPRAAASGPDPDDAVRDHLMTLVEGATRFEVTDDGKRLEGRRIDLPPSSLRRLRHGELPIDGRLDLHGKNTDEARAALESFLKERRVRRDRVVLVIHGRGEHSPAGVGVLRGEIAAWLSQGRSSQHVAAFATAAGDDGGEGALYVLLRP